MEMPSEITRCVCVDRARGLLETLDAMGGLKKIITGQVEAIPGGRGERVEVVFFAPRRYIRPIKLEEVYGQRGLSPVDPLSLAAIAGADPSFFDDRICCTQWSDATGEYYYIAFGSKAGINFGSSKGDRYVIVGPRSDPYPEHIWFAGLLRK